jgi:hypothetical protein
MYLFTPLHIQVVKYCCEYKSRLAPVAVDPFCLHSLSAKIRLSSARWFKYDRDHLCVNKSQFVPVIFEPPCINAQFIFVLPPIISPFYPCNKFCSEIEGITWFFFFQKLKLVVAQNIFLQLRGNTTFVLGYMSMAQFDEALPYKPEGYGFDSRWGHWDIPFT